MTKRGVDGVGERICSATRRRSPERTKARETFEFEKVFSCCSSEWWWRTELDFGSSESLDDLHRAATLGATIKVGGVSGGGSGLFGRRFLSHAQQLKAKGQGRGTPSVGEETEMPDAHETLRKDVQ